MTTAQLRPTTLKLHSMKVVDLMSPNPVSISQNATIHEAVAFLVDRSFGAAPVIDQAGRAVGVLSRSDIVRYDRERVNYLEPVDFYTRYDLAHVAAGSDVEFQVEQVDRTSVREIMTPVVFSVRIDATATELVREMLQKKVHRLFVEDENGILVGVVTTFDLLKHLVH